MIVNNLHKSQDGVYIGRGSKWGNPFVIGPDGNRQEVLRKYREYLDDNPWLKVAAENELVGQNLLCYCAPLPCHGDILIEIANKNSPDYLNNPLI